MRSIVFASLAFALMSNVAIGAEKMNGDEFKVLLSTKREILLGGPGQGYSGSLTLTPDGKGNGQVTLESGDVIGIKGVWKIKKNRFFRTWEGGRDAGKEICETWVKTGPKAVKVMVGKENKGNNYWK